MTKKQDNANDKAFVILVIDNVEYRTNLASK